MSRTAKYTDGQSTYEVIADQRDQNSGRAGGVIDSIVLRNIASGFCKAVHPLDLTLLTELPDLQAKS